MDPPLRRRLSWRTPIGNGLELSTTPATMARTGAWFAWAGALVGLVSVAISSSPALDSAMLALVSAAAAALGGGLILAYDRLPPWSFHLVAAGGTALASLAVAAWGTESTYGPLPYLFVTAFVFYFFPLGPALVHMALIAAAYAITLTAESLAYTPVDGWFASVATLLGTGVAVVLVRERVRRLAEALTDAARRDPLTGLLNRRGLEETFDLELERARRTGAPLSLVLGELDRSAGDEALHRIGRVVRTAKRSFDVGARIGREELALLAPDADEHGAYMLAERIRVHLERAFATSPVPLTASLGIATFPLHGQGEEAVMRAAGQARHAAKRLGGNRSVISSAEVPGILTRGAPGPPEEGQVELGTLVTLAEALDVRDAGNPAHCRRVGRFAELMARELGLAPDAVERVRLGGLLHDVGRVGIPDELLAKQGSLTEEEWTWVRSHPEVGARMVETTEFQDIGAWILAHHERPDGRGYPRHLAAEEVPLEARILAVADAYEAMTAARPYRPALPPDQAAEELRRGAGEQFDPQVVDALLRVV